MELGLFDEVGDLVRSLVPDDLGPALVRSHRGGVKVWFGPAKPPKEHYEAQFVRSQSNAPTLEVGWHAEHREPAKNSDRLNELLVVEKKWRRELGKKAEAGEFLGQDAWRRLSEVWEEVDVEEDEDLAFEIASRLVDYIQTLEPLLRA